METYDVIFQVANNETNNYPTCQSLFDFLKLSLFPINIAPFQNLNKKIDVTNYTVSFL